MNRDGRIEIAKGYEYARQFSGGLALVMLPPEKLVAKGSMAFIKPSGEVAFRLNDVAVEPDEVVRWPRDFADGRSLLWVGAGFAVVDMDGKRVSQELFDDCNGFQMGLAPVKKNGKWGLVNSGGAIQVACEYISIVVGADNTASACDNDGYLLVDTISSAPLFAKRFRWIGLYSDGLAPAIETDIVGYIDRVGNWQIEPQWFSATAFANNLAAVKEQNGKYIYINRTGIKVSLESYFYAMRPEHGVIVALRDTTTAICLNRDMKTIGEFKIWAKMSVSVRSAGVIEASNLAFGAYFRPSGHVIREFEFRSSTGNLGWTSRK